MLNLKALSEINGILRGGVSFNRMADFIANPVDKLSRNQKSMLKLKAEIEGRGINEVRMESARKIYNAELKGRTLQSVADGYEKSRATVLAKAVSKSEEEIAEQWIALKVKLHYETLKFFQGLFIDDAKATKAVAELTEAGQEALVVE